MIVPGGEERIISVARQHLQPRLASGEEGESRRLVAEHSARPEPHLGLRGDSSSGLPKLGGELRS